MGRVLAGEGEKKRVLKQTLRDADWLPRMGFLARGLLYATVGFLAFQMAIGAGGMTTDFPGALVAISSHGMGKFTLVLVGIGLIGYSLWGFARALLDNLNRGTSPKGLAERGGFLLSGISYAALLIPTVRLILGNGTGNDEQAQDWTQWLLMQWYGPWIVGAVGVVAIIGSLGQFQQAFTAGFKKDFNEERMGDREMAVATRLGRVGMAARGVVFMLGGWFVIVAALRSDADEVRGLDGALLSLLQHSYGTWLLGVVALGLLAFGAFSALSARWIKVVKAPGEE